MANGAILTAEQERKLRQPIDEYVGKIQKEIDELKKQFSVYKAKMESLLISQLELIKDINKDQD